MRAKRIAGWLPLCLLVLAAAAAPGVETVSPADYQQRLAAIAAALERGDRSAALSLSEMLAAVQVSWPEGALPADPTITALIRSSAFAAARLRLNAVQGSIAASGNAPAVVIDATALATIAEREANARLGLRTGGDIAGLGELPAQLPESWSQRLYDAVLWLRGCLSDFVDWLRSWLRNHSRDGDEGGKDSAVMPVMLTVVGLIMLVVVVMAWNARRTTSPLGPLPALSATPTGVDADPRTRAVDEWLAYARHLMAAGRHREATRAWYHALLVQCWSKGLLHHRIGRTNWEYALALPASVGWRRQFQGLTGRYDLIWYGGRDEADAVREFAHEAGGILAILGQAAPVDAAARPGSGQPPGPAAASRQQR
jgi:hypothetical protein